MVQEGSGQTLQPTALVHEAYLRLVGKEEGDWEIRTHVLAASAQAMQRILVERARKCVRLKRRDSRMAVSTPKQRRYSPAGPASGRRSAEPYLPRCSVAPGNAARLVGEGGSPAALRDYWTVNS